MLCLVAHRAVAYPVCVGLSDKRHFFHPAPPPPPWMGCLSIAGFPPSICHRRLASLYPLRVKCLAQEHMTPGGARNRTNRSRSHTATQPRLHNVQNLNKLTSVSWVCLVIDHEFRHIIVGVAVDLRVLACSCSQNVCKY